MKIPHKKVTAYLIKQSNKWIDARHIAIATQVTLGVVLRSLRTLREQGMVIQSIQRNEHEVATMFYKWHPATEEKQ